MTLLELKNSAKTKLFGDTLFSNFTNEELNEIIKEGILYVANRTIPIDLLGRDINSEKVIRFINSTQWIRFPKDVVNDTDKVDIDEQLAYAIVYYVVQDLTKDTNKKILMLKRIDSEIDVYEYNNQTLINTIKEEND